MTTRRMIVMLLLTTVVFGGVFGLKYMGRKGMNAYFDNMPAPPATISAAPAAQMRWDNKLEAIGSVVAINGTDVTTESGGIVTAIHFESGARVDKGAPLLTLDSAKERAELQRLRAQAALAQLNLERRQKLFGLEAISKSDLDTVQAEAVAAQAAVAAQQALLAQKEIRAPFAGLLGLRKVNVGQYLAPGTAIVSLQSVDPIDFDFALPEQQLPQARSGLKVQVRVDAYPDHAFTGDVIAVEPRIDESTRNFSLRARLPNPERLLRAGQFGRVTLLLPGERQLLAVPRTAINYSSYGTSVFVVRAREAAPPAAEAAPAAAGTAQAADGKAGGEEAQADAAASKPLEVVQRFVRVGEARGDFVEVLQGVEAGEQVATSGLLKLRNLQPVVIDNTVTPEPRLAPQPAES